VVGAGVWCLAIRIFLELLSTSLFWVKNDLNFFNHSLANYLLLIYIWHHLSWLPHLCNLFVEA
jgi:hypothetical protein